MEKAYAKEVKQEWLKSELEVTQNCVQEGKNREVRNSRIADRFATWKFKKHVCFEEIDKMNGPFNLNKKWLGVLIFYNDLWRARGVYGLHEQHVMCP